MSYCVEETCDVCGGLLAFTCDSFQELSDAGYKECTCINKNEREKN